MGVAGVSEMRSEPSTANDLSLPARTSGMGNSAVLDVEDFLEHFADDPDTRLACLFLEAVRQPERLAAAAMRMNESVREELARIAAVCLVENSAP